MRKLYFSMVFTRLSSVRKGEMSIAAEMLLWSLFPIITVYSLSEIPPLFSAAGSTFFATLFFGVILTVQKKWGKMNMKGAWKDVFLATFFLAILYYGLLFWALTKTSAGNASIIESLQIFFGFFFFEFLVKEKSPYTHNIGAFFMLLGAIIVLFPGELRLNGGDAILLCATALAPVGNYFQKRARQKISTVSFLFFRSFISSLFLFFLATVFSSFPDLEAVKNGLPFLVINGVLLFGLSKILWIEGIHRIPIQKAVSITSVAPIFTLLFAFFLLSEEPTIWQLSGVIPVLVGGILITRKSPEK